MEVVYVNSSFKKPNCSAWFVLRHIKLLSQLSDMPLFHALTHIADKNIFLFYFLPRILLQIHM